MADSKNQTIVVALFDDGAKATAAMRALQAWEKAPDGIKLGALCVIAKNADGHIEYHRANVLDLKRGLTFGLIAGAVVGGIVALPLGVAAAAGALGAGAGVAAGGAAGSVVGGAAGEVSNLLWGFRHDDLRRIAAHLDAGKAALLALTEASEVEATQAELTRLGGTVEQYHLAGEALDHVDAALRAPAPAPPASGAS
jgi:uncharacterized membrane protein